ncbi:MAG TPA: hypothetical protein VFM25_01125, partial [Verrucomicrobiae bacterium]|nr:hypothetical protein [Verrucomicrobiae bacterium]
IIFVKNGKVLTSVYFVLVNSSSNRVYYYAPRRTAERLDLQMSDSKEKQVQLTQRGKQFGAPLSLSLGTAVGNWKHQGLMKGYVPPNGEFDYTLENFTDKENNFDWNTTFLECFKPLPPGNYKLYLKQRLYFADKKGFLQPTTFLITVPVKVEHGEQP